MSAFRDIMVEGTVTYKRKYATNSKLTEKQVCEIYQQYVYNHRSEFDLARLYGVSVSTIYNIIRGRSWRWLNLVPFYRRYE